MVSTLDSLAQSQWRRWSTDMHLLVTRPGALAGARTVVDAELDAIESAASRFRPDSEICALTGGVCAPVSPLLAHLIEDALAAARFTDGDVDPTVGSALIALGYDRDIGELDPAAPKVTSLRVGADWSMVEFDGRSVRLPEGVVLDLGATAKAVAADRCARRVYAETGSGVLVNLGGDISTAGPTPEGGWQVLVQDTENDPACQVALGSRAGLRHVEHRAPTVVARRRYRPPHHRSPDREIRGPRVAQCQCGGRQLPGRQYHQHRGDRSRAPVARLGCRTWRTGPTCRTRRDGTHDRRVAAVTQRLHIDWTRCDGRGLCVELLPDLFTRDDWGYPLAHKSSREPAIPAQSAKYAKAAVKRCPRMALRLLD